jgi:hypothetical protein
MSQRLNPNGLPTVLFLGWGRAGKDEAAAYVASRTQLRYGGSTSWAALPHMASFLGVHPQVAWETRHTRRQLWKDELDRLRISDQCYLARRVLEQGEVTAGLRDKVEVEAVRAAQLFDHIVWIHRPGVPADPTVTFTSRDCDDIIHNEGTLEEFHQTLDTFIFRWNLPLR